MIEQFDPDTGELAQICWTIEQLGGTARRPEPARGQLSAGLQLGRGGTPLSREVAPPHQHQPRLRDPQRLGQQLDHRGIGLAVPGTVVTVTRIAPSSSNTALREARGVTRTSIRCPGCARWLRSVMLSEPATAPKGNAASGARGQRAASQAPVSPRGPNANTPIPPRCPFCATAARTRRNC